MARGARSRASATPEKSTGSVGTEVAEVNGPPGTNVAVVAGTVVRLPQERVTGDGQTTLSFELRVRARPDGPSELVPVSWPDRTLASTALDGGSAVVVVGRIRQRFFRVGGATQSRTELVAESVVGLRHHAAVRKVLARAVERLTS